MRCGEMLAGVATASVGRSFHAIPLIDELLDTGKAAEDDREGPEELRPQLDGLSQAIEALVTRMMAIRRERP